MILTQEQIKQRIESPDNLINKLESHRSSSSIEVIVKDGVNNHKGNLGVKHLDSDQRLAIGVLAQTTDHKTVAEVFGISESHVNDLATGNRTIGNGKGGAVRVIDNDLKNQIAERINKTKLTIQERAAETLLKSLGLLTDDKLENSSAKEIAQITTQMSQVMRNLTPESQESNKNSGVKVQIVLHQPKQAREEAFDYIEVSA